MEMKITWRAPFLPWGVRNGFLKKKKEMGSLGSACTKVTV